MLVYWIIFGILLYLSLRNYSYTNLVRQKYEFFCLIYFFLLFSLRSYCVGTDTMGYIIEFENLYDVSYSYIWENMRDPIFYFCIKLLNSICAYNIAIFIFIGLIFCFFVGYTLKRESDNFFLSLLIMMLFRYIDFPLGAMRNGIAIAIAFYALSFLFQKKIFKFLLLVLIASLFHKSLLIYCILYPLSLIDFQKVSKLSIVVILFLFCISSQFLYSSLFVYMFLDQYSLYQHDDTGASKILTCLIVSFFYILLLFNQPSKTEQTRKTNILFICCSLSFIFSVMALINPSFGRISLFFGYAFTLAIPLIVRKMIQKMGYSLVSCCIIIAAMFIYILGGPAPGVIPYSFFWSPKLNSVHTMEGARVPYSKSDALPIKL